MRKKWIRTFILLLLLLSLVGCGSTKVEEPDYTGQEYRISYICNGELLDYTPASYIYGDEITLPVMSRKGFEGWYLEKDFTGEVVAKINPTDHSNKTLYAKINEAKETFTIQYFDGEIELNLLPSSYQFGESLTLPIPVKKDGYSFEGWYAESDFKNKVTSIQETDDNNFVFYAKYINEYISSKDAKRLNDVIKTVNHNQGVVRGMPSTGDIKVLVIPVDFTDYKAETNMKQNIETALFGTSEETGWESLQSYYQKSSYGNLNIIGTVTDVYSTGKKSTYFENMQDTEGVSAILKGALEYFDSKIDYSEYDSDKDGLIDSIYLLYTAPVDYDSDDSIWWAFTDLYVTSSYEYYDGVEAGYYFFAGYDFLFEDPASGKKLTYNTETFIHETGHLLGLDDYYDYDDSDRTNQGGIGGGDMMDYNVGDHNAYSKSILGWISPNVIELSGKNKLDITYVLNDFGETGDALIIANKFNNTFYSEYYIIDYYTPDGLNQMEAGNNGLFSKAGIRIYHISSTLSSETIDCIWDITKYNNATAKYKLIKLVEADGKNDISRGGSSENSDLYSNGAIITNLSWNDGSKLNIKIEVTTMNGAFSTLHITK